MFVDRSDHALGIGDRGLGHHGRPCYPHERQSQNLPVPIRALTMPHEKRRKNTAFIVYYLHFEKITGSTSIRTLPRGRPLSR